MTKLTSTELTFIILQIIGWTSFVCLVITEHYFASVFPLMYALSMEIKTTKCNTPSTTEG
jgi:hypothetical protein